ncbi:MAG: hypothetical protein M3N53_13880 [Actinomycetota bacterium]|nr:hypothetical protein [Actinomycetota bacterium]
MGLAALVGGLAGAALASAAGRWYASTLVDSTDAAFATLIAIYLLMWAGATGVPWLVLRRLKDPLNARTTFMVAAGFLAWSVVSVPGVFWVVDSLPASRAATLIAVALLVAMLCVPPALAARWIILTNEKMGEREETSP